MTTAWLSALGIYPVKSVQGPTPGEAAVEPWGLAGDRRWMAVDDTGGALTQREFPRLALARAQPQADGGIGLTAPGMEPLSVAVPEAVSSTTVRIFSNAFEVVEAAGEAGAWFGEFLGTRARLVHMDDPARRRPIQPEFSAPGETVGLADSHPLLLTTTASLDALNSLVAAGENAREGPLPMDRFRPNVVVTGTAPWAEDDWHRVRIGEVSFRVAKPCSRCVITTTDQGTARRGREPLRTLAVHRRQAGGLMFGQKLIPESGGTLRVGDAFCVVE
jgi:uncharacterized protein